MTAASYRRLTAEIDRRLREKGRVIVAIDGRCGSGKTTLAARLAQDLSAAVFHMDDFFLRPHQRTEARLGESGGNVDYERFLSEVLMPLAAGETVTYRPFSCAKKALEAPITVEAKPVAIVEGSYACHPALWEHYDLRVFLTVAPQEQLRRIRLRSGEEKAAVFASRWIPLEERYFAAFDIERRCDIILE